MNILFLSSKSVYPLKDGHSMRSYNILKQAAKNHSIYFLTYFLHKDEEEHFSAITEVCKFAKGFKTPFATSRFLLFLALIRNMFSLLPFVAQKYRSKEMGNEIRRILSEEKIDVIHVDILPLMTYYRLLEKYPVLLVEHNVESLLLKRRVKYTANIFAKFFWWLQYIKLAAFEKKQLTRVACCAAVSFPEKEILQKMGNGTKIEVVPNGVDVQYFVPKNGYANTKNLVFLGSLNWFPNYDGMHFFCEKIYPEISRLMGDAKILVVGKENKRFVYAERITQTGFVDDVRSYIASASIFIVPLRIGGGTRLKILDAMAMGKAIVSTTIGCEGLEVENERHLIIEDNPIRFAKAVVELLNDESKRKKLGENARRLTEEKYDWELIGKKMNAVYESIAN